MHLSFTSKVFLILIQVTACCAQAHAASIEYVDYAKDLGVDRPIEYIRISGTIKSGDARALQQLVLADPARARRANGVMLESPGGSVIEAMKLGRIVRTMFFVTYAGGYEGNKTSTPLCASACFLVFVAGIERTAFDRVVAIHRIFVKHGDATGTAYQSATRLREANLLVREYLEEMEVPGILIDRMRSSSSVELDWLSSKDLLRIGLLSPFWEEFMLQRCGYHREDHERVFLSTSRTEADEIQRRREPFYACMWKHVDLERSGGFDRLKRMPL